MPDAIQLGPVVRGKIRGCTDIDQEPRPGPPDLFGRVTYSAYGGHITWSTETAPKPFDEVFKKACTAAIVVLNTLRLTTVSIRQRAIFYGAYCLSKFTTQKEINLMQVKVAKAVLRRHWIQAKHLPGTLRALKIAPMQDPEIAFACSALGLLGGRAREDDELCAYLQRQNIDYQQDRQLDTALEYLERYLPTLEPNDIRTIQQILATATFERKQPTGPLRQPSRKKGLGKHFKIAMKASRETHAMEYLRTRTLTTWSAAPTYTWMQALTNLHPRLCGPIPRYALLRWTIGGESDCWFWRHFHKLGPCICGCGRLADTYPYGLAQASLAEHRYAEYPAAHIHPDYDSVAQVVLPPLSEAARAYPAAWHCIVLPMTLLLLIGTKALNR